ncbi:unnamed protein product, partial [Meganyctiphanes norvegica]
KVCIHQNQFKSEVQQLMTNLQKARSGTLSNEELKLYQFQAQALNKAIKIVDEFKMTASNESEIANLRLQLIPYMNALLACLMKQVLFINQQMIDDIGCELQRLEKFPTYWKLQAKASEINHPSLRSKLQEVKIYMSPTKKFNHDVERQVLNLLRECELCIPGGLGISKSEKVMIAQAVGLRQGHWYKCPNGHIYCIANCGQANQAAKCPECSASIGGVNHNLVHGNLRADSEMF